MMDTDGWSTPEVKVKGGRRICGCVCVCVYVHACVCVCVCVLNNAPVNLHICKDDTSVLSSMCGLCTAAIMRNTHRA